MGEVGPGYDPAKENENTWLDDKIDHDSDYSDEEDVDTTPQF